MLADKRASLEKLESSACQQLGDKEPQYKCTFSAALPLHLLPVTSRDWTLTASLIIQSWVYILHKVIRGSPLPHPIFYWMGYVWYKKNNEIEHRKIPRLQRKLHCNDIQVYLRYICWSQKSVSSSYFYYFKMYQKTVSLSMHLPIMQITQIRFQSTGNF